MAASRSSASKPPSRSGAWFLDEEPTPEPLAPAPPTFKGSPFRAELDVAELDERLRPGPTWTAKSQMLSRAGMVLVSRRMTYIGRQVVIAVHLIDDEPTPLMGRVVECDYWAEGLHRIVVEFVPIPPLDRIQMWFAGVGRVQK